jgi:putative transposase
MALMRDYQTCEELGIKKPSWMDIKKMFTRLLPEWTSDVPFQIKAIAVKEAHKAFWETLQANKDKGKKPDFKFRSCKDPVQSCYIPKSAISDQGLYPKISGKGLKFSEKLPKDVLDSRLVWRAGRYYLTVPRKQQFVPYGDNQARIVAIDPGVRTFAAFYAENNCGFIGQGDFSRIQRLAQHLDNLISRMSKVGQQKQRTMQLAAAKMREKVKNLVNELHHKTALFLVKNYDCILLPTFETAEMVSKASRKIQSKTVRNLLTFSHYRFKQFLKNKAFEWGKTVVDVCEAFTSKTHPQTGEVKNIGAAKRIRLQSGQWVNRDLVGARNILLRALVDSPHCFTVAVNKCD